MCLEELFASFLKEKTFLNNVSPKTIGSYRQAFSSFVKYRGGLSNSQLRDFVIGMREAGLSPGGCNVYIHSINSFLTWLHENGHCEPPRIKQLPQAKTVVKVFSEKYVQALIRFRPKSRYECRLWLGGTRHQNVIPRNDRSDLAVMRRGRFSS